MNKLQVILPGIPQETSAHCHLAISQQSPVPFRGREQRPTLRKAGDL